MKKLFVIGISLLAFYACEKEQKVSDIKPGSITGVIFDTAGEPKQGIKVKLSGSITAYSEHYGCNVKTEVIPTSASYVTGSDGMYLFENVVPSSVSYACGEGTASARIQYYVTLENGKQQAVTVISNNVTNIDLVY